MARKTEHGIIKAAAPQEAQDAARAGGRPVGSPTVERPVAVAVPARCPGCGGTKHRAEPGAALTVHEFAGTSQLTGQPYRYVVWRKVLCDCGQHFRVREDTMHDPRKKV